MPQSQTPSENPTSPPENATVRSPTTLCQEKEGKNSLRGAINRFKRQNENYVNRLQRFSHWGKNELLWPVIPGMTFSAGRPPSLPRFTVPASHILPGSPAPLPAPRPANSYSQLPQALAHGTARARAAPETETRTRRPHAPHTARRRRPARLLRPTAWHVAVRTDPGHQAAPHRSNHAVSSPLSCLNFRDEQTSS